MSFHIIPAIDLLDGSCVRLLHGDFDQCKVYDLDAGRLARRYAEEGADWLHVVDLDGARHGSPGNLQQIARIAGHLDAGIQVGGGIRDEAAIERLLGLGADRVVIGSVAAEKPGEALAWLREIGPERIVFALDVTIEDQDDAPMLVSRGWAETTRTSLWEALDRFGTGGLRHVLCTDIGRAGAVCRLDADRVRGVQPAAARAVAAVRVVADRVARVAAGRPDRHEDIRRTAGARARAEQLVAQLRAGADFQQAAMTYSDGRQALEGGDLGWRKANELPTLFTDIVVDMQPGEISDPVQSASGFHIILLADYKGSDRQIIRQTHARHILINTTEIRMILMNRVIRSIMLAIF